MFKERIANYLSNFELGGIKAGGISEIRYFLAKLHIEVIVAYLRESCMHARVMPTIMKYGAYNMAWYKNTIWHFVCTGHFFLLPLGQHFFETNCS